MNLIVAFRNFARTPHFLFDLASFIGCHFQICKFKTI